MLIKIIISTKDKASINIGANLKRIIGKNATQLGKHNVIIETIKKELVHYKSNTEGDFLIFCSKHSSSSGEKTLSMHFTGNFGISEYGGKSYEFSLTYPEFMKECFITLHKLSRENEYVSNNYKITLEATHHGPTLKKPLMFIEIGSSEREWKDTKAGEIIAKALIKTIKEFPKNKYIKAIGFGGTHYCPNFNKIELNSGIALSHICPKYKIDVLTPELVKKISLNSELALIDWKGTTSEQRKKLVNILEELNIEWKKTRDIKRENKNT